MQDTQEPTSETFATHSTPCKDIIDSIRETILQLGIAATALALAPHASSIRHGALEDSHDGTGPSCRITISKARFMDTLSQYVGIRQLGETEDAWIEILYTTYPPLRDATGEITIYAGPTHLYITE